MLVPSQKVFMIILLESVIIVLIGDCHLPLHALSNTRKDDGEEKLDTATAPAPSGPMASETKPLPSCEKRSMELPAIIYGPSSDIQVHGTT